MRHFWKWALPLAAATLFGATADAADKTVKIGVLAPLTGPASADGQEFVRGVQMAVDEANGSGGIAGYQFAVAVGDVKDASAGAVTSAAERLLGDSDVHFMITGYASLTNFELDAMAEAGMPYMLAATSTQTRGIVAPNPDKYWCCWSLTPSFDAYNTDVTKLAQTLAASGAFHPKNKTLAMVSSDNAYSKTISEGMKKTFGEAGWSIKVDELVPFGDVTDWRSVLAKVRAAAPDVVINTDYLSGNSAAFLNQFVEQPTDSLLFLQYAPSVPEFIKLTGAHSDGVVYDLLGGVLDSPKNPRAGEVLGKFKAKYGVESGTYGVGLYEMTWVYFDALKKVGDPTQHEAIARAIGATDKQVAEGHLRFDPKTHLAVQGDDAIPITFFQIENGQRVLILPERYATGSFRPQPWMK